MKKPSGIVTTGWPAIEQTCRVKLGESFDDWQHAVGKLALAKRSDGSLAATIGGVGLSVPRQVGKTFLVSRMLFALCINQPGVLAIWTAHHSATHAETFLDMQAFAERSKVAPYIRKVYTGSGDEEVRFLNRSRILFGARDAGFGRGIPGVDVIVFDEAQILTERAIDAMVPTMNTSKIGLHFYIGTPPRDDDPPGPRETFTQMRSDCIESKVDDTVWVEFGADPGSDPDDRRQWPKMNPSFPHRTGVNAMLRMQRKLGDRFDCEGRGIWPDARVSRVIDAKKWTAIVDRDSTIDGELAFGVEVSDSRDFASIGVAGWRDDGRLHLEYVEGSAEHEDGDPGFGWVVPACVELNAQKPRGFVIDQTSPAGSFIQPLRDAGLNVIAVSQMANAQACGRLFDAVVSGLAVHLDQPTLNFSLSVARKRVLPEGAWLWHRRNSKSNITPIGSVTLAAHGLSAPTKKPYDPSIQPKVVVLE